MNQNQDDLLPTETHPISICDPFSQKSGPLTTPVLNVSQPCAHISGRVHFMINLNPPTFHRSKSSKRFTQEGEDGK